MSDENFNINVLPDLNPFTIDWTNIKTEDRKSKTGGTYKVYLLPVVAMGKNFVVEAFRAEYDRLRVLHYLGIEEYNATFGLPPVEGGRPPLLFSGAKNGK